MTDLTGVSRAEQETTVTMTADESLVRVWSCYPPHIRRMRADDRFTEGVAQSGAVFTIPRAFFDPIGGLKRRVSDEQRAALSARMKERFKGGQK